MSPSRTPDTESAAAPATAVRANAASRVQSASSRTTMTGIPWSTDSACRSSSRSPPRLHDYRRSLSGGGARQYPREIGCAACDSGYQKDRVPHHRLLVERIVDLHVGHHTAGVRRGGVDVQQVVSHELRPRRQRHWRDGRRERRRSTHWEILQPNYQRLEVLSIQTGLRADHHCEQHHYQPTSRTHEAQRYPLTRQRRGAPPVPLRRNLPGRATASTTSARSRPNACRKASSTTSTAVPRTRFHCGATGRVSTTGPSYRVGAQSRISI